MKLFAASLNDPKRKMRKVLTWSLSLSIALMVLLGLIFSFYVRKRKKRYLELKEKGNIISINLVLDTQIILHSHRRHHQLMFVENCKKMSKKHYDNDELPQFELAAISEATNEFSLDNKVGEGGFGPVYKVIP